MSDLCHAIVIRSLLPLQSRCLILDCDRGALAMSVVRPAHAQKIVHGGLVTYEIDPRRMGRPGPIFCSAIELVALPDPWVSEDINFLHFLLEMGEAFLSPQQPLPEIVRHFLLLYKSCDPMLDPETFRLWFLGVFFALLGEYPGDDALGCQCHGFSHPFSLISGSRETMVNVRGCAMYREALIRWIRSAVVVHPLAHGFKTVGFLDMVDSL